jgi:ADP-ribosylglycohydrolase
MRYSVVNRFRGALLGAFLGESLASGDETQSQNVEAGNFACLHWGKIFVSVAESLIELGRFDLDDWLQRQQRESPKLDAYKGVSLNMILGTLPITLFFHDNTIKLRQNLLHAVKICHDDPVVRDGTLAVSYALAHSLTEKLNPVTLIPQTISFLGETTTSLPQNLSKVNVLLELGASLERVQAELSREEKLSNAVAMAFYCFLSTLEDYRLSVLRATRNGIYPKATSAITGALSGSYNSTTGIPVNWLCLQKQANSAAWKPSNFSEVIKLADALMYVWSGVYDLSLNSTEVRDCASAMAQSATLSQAIASPRVIRLR